MKHPKRGAASAVVVALLYLFGWWLSGYNFDTRGASVCAAYATGVFITALAFIAAGTDTPFDI